MQIIKDSRGQYVTDQMSRLQYFKNNADASEHVAESTKGKNKIETAVLEKCYAIGLGAGFIRAESASIEEIGGAKSWMEQELMVLIYMLIRARQDHFRFAKFAA